MMLALELRLDSTLGHALEDAGNLVYARSRALPESLEPSARWLQLIELARDYVSRLAQGLASAVAALSPGRICIGGHLGRAIFVPIHAALACELRDSLQSSACNGDIVLSASGDESAQGISSGTLALATLSAPPLC